MKTVLDFDFIKDEDWYFERNYDSVKEFTGSKHYETFKTENINGFIGINVIPFEDLPKDSQISAIQYFDRNNFEILESLANGIIQFYDKIIALQTKLDLNKEFNFPKVLSIQDVKKNFSINTLHILFDQKEDISYYSFECDCIWDNYQSFKILMHQNHIIDFGNSYETFNKI